MVKRMAVPEIMIKTITRKNIIPISSIIVLRNKIRKISVITEEISINFTGFIGQPLSSLIKEAAP